MISILVITFFLSQTTMANEPEKQIAEAAQKVCAAAYTQFVKENPGAKKFSAADKKNLTSHCIFGNQKNASACAKVFVGKIAVLNRNKAQQKEIQEKVKKELQPELQTCLTKVNNKSIEELSVNAKKRLASLR